MIELRVKRQMHTAQGDQWLDVSLNIGRSEFVTIFGASGAGKTTVLRMLAGLTQPQEGHIEVDGKCWFDSAQRINFPVQQRRVGFVSQENSLFPNMTVRQNLTYAAALSPKRGLSPFWGQVDGWISTMGLKGLENQKPHQLSGGQKQRVALARAVIHKPQILLLDEPLSDLDMGSRLGLQEEIIKLHQQTGITTVLVSHDLSEVFKLSRKVFLLEQGRIAKSGSPQEVFINSDVSGKFKFTAEIIEIHKDGVLNILTLAIGHNLTKVVATDEELAALAVGSRVIVSAKAFNPLILKA